jgi:hypothetical protein
MSKILSPNPLVITIVVNEVTGEIATRSNIPIAHIDAMDILLRVQRGYMDDAKAAARAMQKQLATPGGNPGGLPGILPNNTPGGSDGNTKD